MLTLYLAIGFLLGVYIVQRLRSPIKKIPGPWYTNFTGLLLKYHEFTTNRRLYIHDLHEQYGPTVRIAPNEVSFASLEAIREIYASGGSGYDKTELYDLFRQFGLKYEIHKYWAGDTLICQRKRELADRYAMTNILREDHVSAVENRARAFVSRCLTASESVDVYVWLHCYALDGVTNFMFSPGGLRSLDLDKDFEIMEELTYHQSLQKNLLHYYLPNLAPCFPSSLSPRRSPITNDYVLRMAGQANPAPHSLLAKLSRKKSPLNHAQIAAECKDHMAAGIDTTGDGLCFLMWALSQPQNARFQEQLFEELSSADTDTIPLDKLPYLEVVVKEGLRCAPPIPMSFPRYVPAGGKSIDGYFVPERTIVSCQPYTVHRLDRDIFPDPDRFNPDRWMDPKDAAERNRLFFAFSTGGRGCTGRNLATVEMKVLLREVYSRYRTTVAEDMRGCMDIDDQIISSRPKGQTCKLRFSER